MHVRFFNTYEPVTTFFRDLLPYLAERGFTVEVLISIADYRQGGRGKLNEVFEAPNIRVRYLSSLGIQPTGSIKKAGIMLAYIVSCMGKTLLGAATDVNFFLSQPPLFSLWGWVLKKLRRQPYICLVMDIYPDVAVMGGLLPKNGLITRLLSRLNKFALQHADSVVVIGRCMAERVEAMSIALEKVHLIPNWANPEVVFSIPPEDNQLRQELGLNGKFVVLYSGNMGISHDFQDLLDVVHHCQEEIGLHFVFIGAGRRQKEIENYITIHQPKNVCLLPFQPLERLAESLSLGDIHFISLREGFEGLVVPSKFYGALAAGRAVIYQGNIKGEIARIILEEEIGMTIESGETNSLFNAISGYYKNQDQAKTHGERAYQLFKAKYQAKTALAAYANLLHQFQELE
ncbi:MAG: glycosyltransferase family 4 protein [Anaerolineae bacterium]|nr:glycosyltransferase family 4 protein [Anaerolineae bacterium]